MAPKDKKRIELDPKAFLSNIGTGRTFVSLQKNQTIYAQGDPSDSVFYVQKGKVKLTVVSDSGKEAIVGTWSDGDFFGEGCLVGQLKRIGTASAMTECTLMRIEAKVMKHSLYDGRKFSEMFVAHLLSRNIRYEEDLVDQLFNSSEKRLARILLLMARFGNDGLSATTDVGKISQGNGRNHTVTSQFLHEQVQAVRFHRLQRRRGDSQFASARLRWVVSFSFTPSTLPEQKQFDAVGPSLSQSGVLLLGEIAS
jgi:CRP-like cAMP-binding protein